MAEVALAKVTRKGQMTIPQELRATLDVGPGDYVALRPLLGGVFLSKAHVTPTVEAEELMRYIVMALDKEGGTQGTTDEKELDEILEVLKGLTTNNPPTSKSRTDE